MRPSRLGLALRRISSCIPWKEEIQSPERSGGGGELPANRSTVSSDSDADAGEDRLSALPDDILVLILLHLHTAAAAQTSVLSRRWRRLWALLPELRFPCAPEPSRTRAVLESHEAALRLLLVGTRAADADSLATWLPAAARRLSGLLVFHVHNLARRNAEEDGEEETAQRGACELPCFENAAVLSLDLGFHGLAMPPAGVFARLTNLCLHQVRFHGPWELGDAISSPRCPCLRKLFVRDARGLDNLAIHSESLLRVELSNLRGLRQLTIVAPALEDLTVEHCFFRGQNQPVASISAPQLKSLGWRDSYDPSSVHLGKMERLQCLSTFFFLVYGQDGLTHNRACISLLRHFKVTEGLVLTLAYPWEVDNYQYLMDDMTVLPDLTFLHLIVLANGHAFGASAFHVLRMCSGIRRLKLGLHAPINSRAQNACPSGCICGQQPNWKAEELLLNRLHEIEITELRGSEHEVTFVKRLFNWAIVLKRMTVTFDFSVTESMAKELCQMLRSFSRPEICMEFYMYQGRIKVLCAPVD